MKDYYIGFLPNYYYDLFCMLKKKENKILFQWRSFTAKVTVPRVSLHYLPSSPKINKKRFRHSGTIWQHSVLINVLVMFWSCSWCTYAFVRRNFLCYGCFFVFIKIKLFFEVCEHLCILASANFFIFSTP